MTSLQQLPRPFPLIDSRSRTRATQSATGSAKRPSPVAQHGHHHAMEPHYDRYLDDMLNGLDDTELTLAELIGMTDPPPWTTLDVDQQ